MGIAQDIDIITMEEKKSIKTMLTKPLKVLNQALFHKKKDKKLEKKQNIETQKPKEEQISPVDKVILNFEKLKLQKENNEELMKFSFKQIEENDDDELEKFSFKVVDEERKTERTDSQSSQDSGFSEHAEKQEDLHDDVIDSLKTLSIDTKPEEPSSNDKEPTQNKETSKKDTVSTQHKENSKKDTVPTQDEENSRKDAEGDKEIRTEDKEEAKGRKKLQTVTITRGPIKHKHQNLQTHPYDMLNDNLREINQVNRQTFSGGHVILKPQASCPEVDQALEKVQPLPSLDLDLHWDIVQELIDEDNQDNLFHEFINQEFPMHSDFNIGCVPSEVRTPESNPIEEFEQLTNSPNYDNFELDSLAEIGNDYINEDRILSNILTPPRSVNNPSPFSDTTASFYPSNTSDRYTLSPQLASPNSEYEKYQDIQQLDEIPSCVESFEDKEKKRERNTSTSSMTMKQYKDMQKDLSSSFSNKECCQAKRKSCKELFQEQIKKLSVEERKTLCVKVSGMKLDEAYGVLHRILLDLSRGGQDEPLRLAVFVLICDRVFLQKPQLFLEDFGLSLLKAASMRCPSKPLLTRYLAQQAHAAHAAHATHAGVGRCVFTEIDAQGDNLLAACARRGDACADVLFELVDAPANATPLFDVHHGNAEGYTALHVGCLSHGASSPALHAVHVLLTHGQADLWKGDVKGSDSALHLAVNSAECDLKLVMLLFRHVDRKFWKKLAHLHNRSSVTPLEYARSACRSTTRQNYPQEVLEFLKKCR